MSRVEKSESWISSADPTALHEAADEFLRTNSMQTTSDDGNVIQAKQGSQAATRLAGGWFINAAKLPKSAEISFTPTEGGTTVSAHIEESLGFGLLDRKLKKKYEEYFNSWISGLRAALK